MPTTAIAFPDVDASTQAVITDDQARFFRDNGLLILRNVLGGAELGALQEQTLPLIERAMRGHDDPDYFYKTHGITGERVPYRVEYVIDKTGAGKALLGHPFILRTVEKLQGRSFIPTWDSMVFKRAGAGAAIPWHRDGGIVEDAAQSEGGTPIFNVDFYLDEADLTNCLWGILGSNRWTPEAAQAAITRLNEGGEGAFHTEGAVPILMRPGDVILHNVRVLHGSPAAQSHLRRVVYYEFRPAPIETKFGPHTPEYIPLKQKVLLACLRHRTQAEYARDETPFSYRPDPAFAPPPLGADEELETYRYPHRQFWRASPIRIPCPNPSTPRQNAWSRSIPRTGWDTSDWAASAPASSRPT